MKQEFDVLFVGAGPASLAGALHLRRFLNRNPRYRDLSIAVLEKGPNPGDHAISGALLDPKALAELFPDFLSLMHSFGPRVASESLSLLTEKSRIPAPIVPPHMRNGGSYIISLSEFTRWLASACEAEGVEIYCGEPADDIIIDDAGAVRGVLVKEKGIAKDGSKKPNYLEPTEVTARATVFGEGSCGHLTKKLIAKLGLCDDRIPQGNAIGLKELWEVEESRFHAGEIEHTLGWPLGFDEFGGGFIYHHRDRQISLGIVIGLDYRDAQLDPFEELQRFKSHPHVRRLIDGGKLISYGARTISEGGLYCMPRTHGDGFLIVGEAAGFLNPMKLKGIHLSMKSGMCAAETIFDAIVKDDFSAQSLAAYDERIGVSWIWDELWRTRNFHQGFHRGFARGVMHAALQTISGGRGLFDRMRVKPDAASMKPLSEAKRLRERSAPNGRTSFDRPTCIFASGTKHDENQPPHLIISDSTICAERCLKEFGNPCLRFCPAGVYEMVKDEDGKRNLQFNPANCIHCKCCGAKDPYGVIEWSAPEGGGGPNYKGM